MVKAAVDAQQLKTSMNALLDVSEMLMDEQPGSFSEREATALRVHRYHSLCGAVEVRRDTYRLAGVHNGPTVVPLEIEAGIGATLEVACAYVMHWREGSVPTRDHVPSPFARSSATEPRALLISGPRSLLFA